MATEILHEVTVSFPDSSGYVDSHIQTFYDRAVELREKHFPELDLAGQLAFDFALIQSSFVRPLVRAREAMIADGWLTAQGGDDYNRHRAIDDIGSKVLWYLLNQDKYKDTSFGVYIEESGIWVSPNTKPEQEPEWNIVVDPIDGTNCLLTGEPYSISGIVIADPHGKLLAGAAVNLTGDELLFAGNARIGIYELDDRNYSVQASPISENERHGPLKTGILGRRTDDSRVRDLVEKGIIEITYPAFGWSLIKLVKGDIDMVMDPFKGQYWYEVAVWGLLADAFGMQTILDYFEQRIGFDKVLEIGRNLPDKDAVKDHRIQVVIRHDRDFLGRIFDLMGGMR